MASVSRPAHVRIRVRLRRTDITRIVSLALVCGLVGAPQVGLQAQTRDPAVGTGVVLKGTGAISGSVASSSGRPVAGISIQLVDFNGSIVSRVSTARNGEFKFPDVAFGTYTVQCVGKGNGVGIIGTSSVTLAGPSEPVRLVCTVDPGFPKTWGVLAGLVGAAVTVVAITARPDDVSGSR